MHTTLVNTGYFLSPDHCGAVQGDADSNIGIFALTGVSLKTRLGSLGLVGRGAMPMLQVDTVSSCVPDDCGAGQGDANSDLHRRRGQREPPDAPCAGRERCNAHAPSRHGFVLRPGRLRCWPGRVSPTTVELFRATWAQTVGSMAWLE